MMAVFDIDGTLSDCTHRLHYITSRPKDFDAFHAACLKDPPILEIIEIAQQFLHHGHHVELWTGRPESIRGKTIEWLGQQGVQHFAKLKMRPENDKRPSELLKGSWLKSLSESRYPDIVFEDDDENVEMFRSHGVRCCHVGRSVGA